MKSYNSPARSSRSCQSWIAGILLCVACILFIISHIDISWGVFPFKYRDMGTVHSGLWRRNAFYGGRLIVFKINCESELKSCTTLIISRVFMIMACITSGIGVICLFILLIFNKKFKSISYISGLSLAFLSFVFGIIGFLSGYSWVIQFEEDTIGCAAYCALIGSFLALVSAICVFFINSQNSI